MNISRRDDRHNADLAKEITDSFNRAIGERKVADDRSSGDAGGAGGPDDPEGGEQTADDSGEGPETPRFVVTGDRRDTEEKRRR